MPFHSALSLILYVSVSYTHLDVYKRQADLRTKGWELVVAWNDRFNVMDKPFNYGVSFGIGDNVSKITKYDNPNKEISSPYVGQRLGDIWGYMVDGYFATDEEAANYGVDQSVVNLSLIHI